MPYSSALLRRLGPQPLSPYRGGLGIPVRVGHQTEMVDRQILHAYLPHLTGLYRSFNGVLDLNHLLRHSSIFCSSRFHRRRMEETLSILVSSLALHPHDFHTTNLDLQNWLESTLYSPQYRDPHYHLYGTTYQYFACLAYLADRFESSRLRRAILHFFTHHGSTISQGERNPMALFDWAHSIFKAIRNQEDLVECFRLIVLSRPDFARQMCLIARQNPTPTTRMICQGIRQIVARVEDSVDMPLIQQDRGNFRQANGIMRRTGMGQFSVRTRRPGFARTLSGTLVPKGAGGIPVKTVVKMEKRRVDCLEDRLNQLEGGVQELAQQTAERHMRGDGVLDDVSNWSDSDYAEDEWSI